MAGDHVSEPKCVSGTCRDEANIAETFPLPLARSNCFL